MVRKILIISLLVVALLVAGGFYFGDFFIKNFYNFSQQVENLQHSTLENLISKVKEQILAPSPLNIGGKENNAAFTRAAIIVETNAQRQDNGSLPALKENARLNAAAQAKAEDMFKNQYFEHVSPAGVDPGQLVKSFGYDYIVTGENLIMGNFSSEKEIVQLWMNSPGHRANILNNRFADIGVAIVKGKYKGTTTWIGVQEFGLPLSACTQPSLDLKARIETNRKALDDLTAQINAKKQQIENTDQKNSDEYNALVDEYNALVARYNPLVQETKDLISSYNSQVNAFNACVAGK